MSSTFGKLFCVSTFGESHCPGTGVIVDGCLPGLPLTRHDIQCQLDRRRPGQSAVSTQRQEADQVVIQSGTEHGLTLGTPISLFVPNADQRPGDYRSMTGIPRPSHADFTYQKKYGIRASSGGGRASARETIGRVCAGAIAEKLLNTTLGIDIVAWVSQVGTIRAPSPEADGVTLTRAMVDANTIRCPDADTAKAMEAAVLQARAENDSIGGIVSCTCTHVPAGLGEPVFDKLEALLAHAMLSIPAAKGFDTGSGFAGAQMRGSAHNDLFVAKAGGLGTATNFSGGIQGGISNGEPVTFRVAFKPPATIGIEQETVDFQGQAATLAARGRHDPCVVSRAVPIVESMAALVLADVMLQQQARLGGMALMSR